jgi:SAM-dependent methyltransferase
MTDRQTATPEEANAYHLGTSDEELDRLGYQHQVWEETTLQLWSAAGFGFGQTLLDLGCGPGFATLELARLVGRPGRVHAIDASTRFIAHLQRCLAAGQVGNVAARSGDVHALDLADGTVDGAFARWLLCFVTEPQRVCDEVARVLRPGGVFVAWDYFNYLAVGVFPERPAICRLFEAYHESAIRNGGSYDVADRLPAMMRRSGLELEQLLPINRVARPGTPVWRWVSRFHANYVPRLVESGLMTGAEADALQVAWSEAEQDPASFFFAPPMLGIIARKRA